jgi:hypothetical protein
VSQIDDGPSLRRQVSAEGLADGELWAVGGELIVKKHNLAAAAGPTANDDSADGYSIGSIWIYGSNVYLATAVGVGAAAWRHIYPASTSLDSDLEDIAALTATRGDLLVADTTPAWSILAKGSACQFLGVGNDGLDPGWRDIPQMFAGSDIYGTGADGVVTYSTNTTITSDVHATMLTVNSGVVLTIGWNASAGRPARIYATVYVRVIGTIRANGSNGGNATASVGGAGGASTVGCGGGGGGFQSPDTAGAGGTSNGPSRNGATPSGNDGGEGGSFAKAYPTGDCVGYGWDWPGYGGNGGGNNSTSPGGGGGGGGGVIQIFTPMLWSNGEPSSSGVIEAKGGNGGTGGGGFRGGHGGHGGTIVLVQRQLHPRSLTVNMSVAGGTTPSGGFGWPGGYGLIVVVSETPFCAAGFTVPASLVGGFCPVRMLPE